jgi:TPR repeat protein
LSWHNCTSWRCKLFIPYLPAAHLRPGKSAELLTHDRTLDLYRENAKKTNDPELIFEFAVFMIDAAKSMVPPPNADDPSDPANRPNAATLEKRDELIREATSLLKRLADRGYPDAQYFLADCYANGIGTTRGKQDFDKAFPLFALAAKHGHPEACYRAGTCCEHGWGTRRESAKAIQFYKWVFKIVN